MQDNWQQNSWGQNRWSTQKGEQTEYFDGTCDWCGRRGHRASKCWFKQQYEKLKAERDKQEAKRKAAKEGKDDMEIVCLMNEDDIVAEGAKEEWMLAMIEEDNEQEELEIEEYLDGL